MTEVQRYQQKKRRRAAARWTWVDDAPPGFCPMKSSTGKPCVKGRNHLRNHATKLPACTCGSATSSHMSGCAMIAGIYG